MNKNNLPLLTTDRLRVRNLCTEDAEELFLLRSNPQIHKFQNWKPASVEGAMEFIRKNSDIEIDTPNTWFELAITTRESNRLIGDLALHFLEAGNPQCEIGFSISPTHQKLGYATEAVIGLVEFLFNDLKKHRVFASVDPENLASIRVLEKSGLKKEAHFRKSLSFKGRWVDDAVYAALKDEWIKEVSE